MLTTKSINPLYYIFLLTSHIALVWLLPYIPTQDGPSHIYNLVILHDLVNGGKEWGDFYTYQLRAVPNLGFHLIAYPMLQFMPPLVVEKVFISIYILLMGISVPVFLRTFGRPAFPLSYFIFPVIFNFTFLWGFYSYVISIPLFLLAFSFCWNTQKRSAVYRFIWFNLIGATIFYFHLIPFVFFIISLLSITIAETDHRRKIGNLLQLLIIISPCIILFFAYLLDGAENSFPNLSYLLSFSRYFDLIIELLSFSTVNFQAQMLPASLFMSSIFFLGYLSAKEMYQRRLKGDEILASEKTLFFLSSALILIYLIVPFSFGNGSMFNERFPWVILLIMLPLLGTQKEILSKSLCSITIGSIATVFFAFNAVILCQQSGKVKSFLSGLHMELPKGSYLMTYKAKPAGWSRVDVLLHAASYYGLFRGCVDIGNYETDYHYFPVHFKKGLPEFPDKDKIAYEQATIRWPDYPSIQYLLSWEISNNDRTQLERFYRIIWEEGPFNIWQRRSPVF